MTQRDASKLPPSHDAPSIDEEDDKKENSGVSDIGQRVSNMKPPPSYSTKRVDFQGVEYDSSHDDDDVGSSKPPPMCGNEEIDGNKITEKAPPLSASKATNMRNINDYQGSPETEVPSDDVTKEDQAVPKLFIDPGAYG